MSSVVIVGLGYVGLPLAIRAAEVGHRVIGLEVDPSKVVGLQQGHSHVEDVSDDRLLAQLGSGQFRPVLASRVGQEIDGADFYIITVPTPLRDGVPDLGYVESAARLIGPRLRSGSSVVLESTTYPGTTEGLLADVLSEVSGFVPGADFHLGFSPERIDPGPSSPHTLENTPKLVSATTAQGLVGMREFYETIVDTVVPVSSPRVAEMAKVFENTQAYVNIALINELADICRELDIDVFEMIDAAMTKGHSMAYWTPGPGVGGHCLPIDPLYLAWQTRKDFGRVFRFAELAHEVNQARPQVVVDRITDVLNRQELSVNGAEVLVLGVAYKPGVGDVRESPAVEIVNLLVQRGARVTICDPHVQDWKVTPTLDAGDLAAELPRFSLSVVITDHDEFDMEKVAEGSKWVLDCRNAVPSGPNVVRL